MVFAENRGHRRAAQHFSGLGAIARDQIQAFAIFCRQNGMNPVVTPGGDVAQQFHLVGHLIAIAVADPIETAGDFFVVVIHSDVECAEGEDHAIDRADLGGNFFHFARIEALSRRGGGEAQQSAVLITRIDAALVIATKIDPRTLVAAGNRVEQFHLKPLRDPDVRQRSGFDRIGCGVLRVQAGGDKRGDEEGCQNDGFHDVNKQ